MVLMASDLDNTISLSLSEETRQDNVKQSGRKKSKSNELKKKQPQRGMGVAQLERLRLQERCKKLTEINPLHSLNLHQPHFFPSSLAGPTPACVPVQFAKYSTYGPMNGVGRSGLYPAPLLQNQRFVNGGFHGLCDSSGIGRVSTAQFQVDPSGVGALSPGFRDGNAIETSGELSSMPNMGCYSEHSGVCHKNNRINGGNFGCKGVRDMHTELSPIHGCILLGFNLGNNQKTDGESQDGSTRALSHAGYAGYNVDQEVEVVAVHRKRSSGGGSVLMEYEFFPGKGGRSSSSEEYLKMGSEASDGEAYSCVTTATTGVNASNSIDLSLKLSY
ncbi:hypothetical protein F0562_010238 [Nyssa sinensis]|uniref:Uncharacterized protein n=1 Tax=Nyssa sinensis TaxID=561372 RepID=A0A5J4ZYA6_9ASTE|nr:hypothetical protein F0562_010238 [Nyssa sinensis]